METPLLAATLIVKNEERNLPGCLESLRRYGDLIDAIYIYDTGSTDRTVEIARAAGCLVEEGHWDDDFARAKNAAGAMANAKWILSIDADERLFVLDPVALRQILRRGLTMDMTGIDAMKVAVIDVREGVEVQAHDAGRLYRPSRVTWVGRVHERLARVGSAGDPSWAEPGRNLLRLDHYGYGDHEKNPERYARNLRLADAIIEEQASNTPGDRVEYVHALVDRGRTRRAVGDINGALDDLRLAWSIPIARTYRAFGGELLAETLTQVGLTLEARAVVKTLRQEGISHPNYCDWLDAAIATAEGDTPRALELLRNIDVLASALGLVVTPRVIVEDHMWAAIAEGEHLEAASSLVALMASHGVVRRKYGDLLVALTTGLPPEGLVEIILDHDRGHLEAVLAELDLSGDRGPQIAALLRRRHAGRSGSTSNSTAPQDVSLHRKKVLNDESLSPIGSASGGGISGNSRGS